MKDIDLFRYALDTPVTTLRKHHLIARAIIYSALGGLTLFFGMALHCLFSNPSELFHTVMMAVFWASVVMIIPAALVVPWLSDIEKEFRRRGLPIPGNRDMNRRFGRLAWKCGFNMVAVFVVLEFFRGFR